MKKIKDSFQLFSSKSKRDNEKNQDISNRLYKIGSEIEEKFDEDVENIKFNADDISSYFVKNNESLNKEIYRECDNKKSVNEINIYKRLQDKKIKTLFDTSICGPYICCIFILSKKENVNIEYIYPHIDINEKNIILQIENETKVVTPFNVWYRYKGEWKEDIENFLIERIFLLKEMNTTTNVLYNLNIESTSNNEYNILYGNSGNRYYSIVIDYLEENIYKEIMIISQIPYYNFISCKFLTVMESFLIDKEFKKLKNFVDSFSEDNNIFEKITFDDYYLNLSNNMEQLKNMKLENMLIFLKALLLEKKIVISCSKKEMGCKYVLLFLSFIPDIINLGFNIKNYEDKFEEWIKLKLPLILFHETYVLLLHIDNLKLFNNYTCSKNYFISTTIDSDVYKDVQNNADLLYDVDKDSLVINNDNLMNVLKLTKFENNHINKIHSIFKSFFNFSSLIFENIKPNETLINLQNINYSNTNNIISNFNRINEKLFCNQNNNISLTINNSNMNNINNNNNNSNSNDEDDNNNNNDGADIIHTKSLCDMKTINMDDYKNNEDKSFSNLGYIPNEIKGENQMEKMKEEKVLNGTTCGTMNENSELYMNEDISNGNNININNINNNNKFYRDNFHLNDSFPSNECNYENFELIDDEDDIYIINLKEEYSEQVNFMKDIERSESNYNTTDKMKGLKRNDELEKYVIDIRNHFHIYFNELFTLSKEYFEEGMKEKKNVYEENYNNLFIEMWEETTNFHSFIEKDHKINKFLKIAEENNILFDKRNLEKYTFINDLLIIEKGEYYNETIDNNNNNNLKEVLIISLKGYVYEGTYCFLKNCKEGLGKFVSNIYDITFQGEWHNDQINGSGHLYHKNFKYFGKFKNNLFTENGIFVDNLLNQYEGEFLNGYFNGNGKLIYNKNTYIGIFKNNNLIGQGKILYNNGSVYTGEIKNFLPHGYGFLSYDDSAIFEGYFIEGKKCGNGFLTLKCNDASNNIFSIEGKWENDEPVMRKSFHIVFPNKDKYIGKIYILPNSKRNNKYKFIADDTVVNIIEKKLNNVNQLIETIFNFMNHTTNDNKKLEHVTTDMITEEQRKYYLNVPYPAEDINNVSHTINDQNGNNKSITSNPQSISGHQKINDYQNDDNYEIRNSSILNGIDNPEDYSSFKKKDSLPIIFLEENQTSIEFNGTYKDSDDSENAENEQKTFLKEKLQTFINNKKKKVLKNIFDILDQNWLINNTEKKLNKNKNIVEYLQQKKLFIVPHRKGLSIYNKKKENYNGKFCLGMKHGYGIYVYDHINRYEGYWFRGMKHGYAILYEGDNIYYAHFNYDKLISKEIILPQDLDKYKPKKETSKVKVYNNEFLINQSFFNFKDFISTVVCNYL
ncbi:MORN repeat protein, putative [Plasmodium sp. gorilla clade G2]|uniref:MORN repeat protein, putative n=1 Tax=Plasmodium sp. gorilla clade G2 TaxID=880535 RepID=UPI000D2155A8|nr:MORN repeat protein, putative [Plasmodium sp. gorilla clade G2]SOV11630.1 MORN repeat protein, putative [Plasmodium sp. gorilla clade G2]